MRTLDSKFFVYPIFALIIFVLLCFITQLQMSPIKKDIKLEELRKTSESSSYKDGDNEQIIANIYYNETYNNYSVINHQHLIKMQLLMLFIINPTSEPVGII